MNSPKKRPIVWWIVGLLVVLGITGFILRGFFHPYRIPTGSMAPTLPVGSYVTVNDWAYQSVDQIKRGDVIAFEPPPSTYTNQIAPGTTYLFRVIGLPGDTVEFDHESQYIINGVPLEQMERGRNTFERQNDDWYQIQPGRSGESGKVSLEEGNVFVVGDNRENALDSRYFGPVSFNLVKGKARVD